MFHTQRLWTGFIALCLSAVAHPVPCVKGAEPQEQMLQLKHQFDAQRKAGQLDAAAQTGQELLALAEKALPGASEIIGSILNDLSLIYGDLGKYEQARAAIERALTLAEKSAGKDSPQAAAVHFNLAAVLRKLEQDDQAAAHYQRCIEIVAAQFGPQYAHPVNTSSLNNLAEIYRRRRDLARAEQLHKQALAIREKSLPPDHRDLATSLGNLGLVYFEQGRYSEAEPLYRRAMQIEEKLGAAALPQLKASLHNLGRLFQKQARYEDAVQVFQRLLGLAQQQDGPDAADAIHNIAQARLRQGQYAEAEKLERQAIDIWQRVRGPGHPDVALGAGSLAAILEAQGKFTEADLLHQQMSAILAKSLGPNHPLVCDSLNSRASLCESQRQPQRAEEFYQQALRLGEQIYGPNHPKLADTLSGLGRTYFSMGRYADAELLIKRALAIRTAALGSSHPDVAACLNDLAALCTEQSRYQEAEPLYREAIAIGQQILGREHAQVGETLGNLAWMYLEQGRLSEALLLMQQAFAIRTRILPAGHIDLASLQNNMAVSCFRAGKYDKAADLLQTSLDTYQRVLGDHHPAVALTLNNLAYVEKEMGNLSRAKQLVDRAIALCKATRTPPMHLANSHYLRAELLWRANQRDAALADLEQALGMYEQQRGSGTGGETERANLFGRFSPAFERMIGWQIEQGAIARALSAAERARSRSLVDQLQLQGVDLLAGVPEPEAMALRKRDAECRLRLAELERQLQVVGAQPQLAESERRQRLLRLVDELDAARGAVIAVYRDVRTASPAYRLAVGAKFEPVPLDQLQAWLAHDKAILLEYALGQQAGYLFVVPAEGQARAVELTVTPEQAQSLGCEPGPLTADRLKSIFTLGGKELLKQLSNPRAAAEASSRLAQLWQLLIPAPQREQLTGGEFNKLIVVPDGALALLPFETLVVRDGEKP